MIRMTGQSRIQPIKRFDEASAETQKAEIMMHRKDMKSNYLKYEKRMKRKR